MTISFLNLYSNVPKPFLAGLFLLCWFVFSPVSFSVLADPVSDAESFEKLRQDADQQITVKKPDAIDFGVRKFAPKNDTVGKPVYFGRDVALNFLYKASAIRNLLLVKLDLNHPSEEEVESMVRALEPVFRDLQYRRIVVFYESDGKIQTVSDTKYEQLVDDVALAKTHSRRVYFTRFKEKDYMVDMGLGWLMDLKTTSKLLASVKHKDECLDVRLAKNASQRFVEPYLRNLGFTNLKFERDSGLFQVPPVLVDEDSQKSSRHGKRARRRGK